VLQLKVFEYSLVDVDYTNPLLLDRDDLMVYLACRLDQGMDQDGTQPHPVGVLPWFIDDFGLDPHP